VLAAPAELADVAVALVDADVPPADFAPPPW
jgi:hypothetical protein